MSVTSPVGSDGQRTSDADAIAERVFGAALGAIDLLAIHLGDRLGWYDTLAAQPATPAELAAATGTAERYAREWLEQQATTGLVALDDAPAAGDPRRYRLRPGVAEALTDRASLAYVAPLARMIAAAATQLPAILEAYRTGGGVGWSEYGADARESQAAMNRPWFDRRLAAALGSVADLDALLRRPGARIADVGFGFGHSSLALARAYPEARVDGFDVDAPSVAAARAHAAEAGLEDRVAFRCADAAGMPEGTYDVVFAFECLHDLPHPVEVLAACRRSLRPGGVVVVMDEAVADDLAVPGDDVDRVMYGFSLLVCLPDGLSHAGSAGTGTVMRPAVLARYAADAGFAGVDVLPIDDFSFFRFYRLTP